MGQLALPYCAKCKKPVDVAHAQHNAASQILVVMYQCHGVQAAAHLTQQDLIEIGPNFTLVDYVEYRRVSEDA